MDKEMYAIGKDMGLTALALGNGLMWSAGEKGIFVRKVVRIRARWSCKKNGSKLTNEFCSWNSNCKIAFERGNQRTSALLRRIYSSWYR